MFSQPLHLIAENDKSVENKNADYETQMNRWFLRPIGIWPLHSDASVIERLKNKIQIGICYLLIFFLLLSCGLHTFLEEKDSATRLKMIGPLSFCLMAISKFFFLVKRRNIIFKCLQHIAKDWSDIRFISDQEIMIGDAKFGRIIMGSCVTFMYGAGIFYDTIMPFSVEIIVKEQNITFRPLVYPVYEAFLDIWRSPVYEILHITQWISAVVMYTITCGVCSVAAIFSSHACGQLKIIIARLDHLVDGYGTNDTVDDRIAEIVELHLRALGFISHVKDVLNEVCLIELIGCTMNICFAGYYVITGWDHLGAFGIVAYSVFFVSFNFNIFIFCFIGEILTEESLRVGKAAYMIEWYRLPGTKASDLILILLMSGNPSSITAGKMVDLSLASFGAVLRTAMAYLNILRQVTT